MREVVHVETQEQYDYVTEKLNYNWNESRWLDERENTCLRIDDEMMYDSLKYYTSLGYKIISFYEFKSRYEPQLKIGDTFEKDGFVCEVKEKIKEPILVGDWIRNDRNMFFKYEKWMLDSPLWVKITNKEFIKQLENNVK